MTSEEVAVGVERDDAGAVVRLDIDAACCVNREQAGTVEATAGDGEITDARVGADVAGGVGRELHKRSYRGAAEVGFVDDPQRTGRDSAAAPAERIGFDGIGRDTIAVDLAIAADKGQTTRRRRRIG